MSHSVGERLLLYINLCQNIDPASLPTVCTINLNHTAGVSSQQFSAIKGKYHYSPHLTVA